MATPVANPQEIAEYGGWREQPAPIQSGFTFSDWQTQPRESQPSPSLQIVSATAPAPLILASLQTCMSENTTEGAEQRNSYPVLHWSLAPAGCIAEIARAENDKHHWRADTSGQGNKNGYAGFPITREKSSAMRICSRCQGTGHISEE
ncbi:MAG: hypothetical protein EZS28_012725, partial [Streblomastix strix]